MADIDYIGEVEGGIKSAWTPDSKCRWTVGKNGVVSIESYLEDGEDLYLIIKLRNGREIRAAASLYNIEF